MIDISYPQVKLLKKRKENHWFLFLYADEPNQIFKTEIKRERGTVIKDANYHC